MTFMFATPGLLLDHVPLIPVLLSVVELPTQMAKVPVMAGGLAITVTVVDVAHPVGRVYVIAEVPGVIAETTPVVEPTVATAVLLLIHVPPPGDNNVAV